ncbi:MAG: patatin family protein [Candidatus Endonucleobacter sp. (ex Gigantidas childressi)]|nr:patatin family protein [Candidatus Endonucleobacter sp. (ex Gigantidas childressi)]
MMSFSNPKMRISLIGQFIILKSGMQAITISLEEQKALVVEGGGMRGVFTAGVLDAFHDKRFRKFDAYYGVSAGALNLTSFLSGQRGRNLRIYTELCQDPQFISVSRFLKGGNMFDLDFLFDRVNRLYSLDVRRFKKTLVSSRFCVVATYAETGSPAYFDIEESTQLERLMLILKASSALPMIYRTPVEVDHQCIMDGSLSDPIPVVKALNDGFRDIILIRTRPFDYQKKTSFSKHFLAWKYRNKPTISALFREHDAVYNNCLTDLKNPDQVKDVRITQIAPSTPLRSGRNTQDRAKLVADYHLGYAQGYAVAERLRKEIAVSAT